MTSLNEKSRVVREWREAIESGEATVAELLDLLRSPSEAAEFVAGGRAALRRINDAAEAEADDDLLIDGRDYTEVAEERWSAAFPVAEIASAVAAI